MQKWRFADNFSFLSPSAHLQHLPSISFLSEKNDRHHHRSHGSFQNARLPIAETTTSFLLFGIVHMALFALLVSYDCLILFAQVFYEATKTDWSKIQIPLIHLRDLKDQKVNIFMLYPINFRCLNGFL